MALPLTKPTKQIHIGLLVGTFCSVKRQQAHVKQHSDKPVAELVGHDH